MICISMVAAALLALGSRAAVFHTRAAQEQAIHVTSPSLAYQQVDLCSAWNEQCMAYTESIGHVGIPACNDSIWAWKAEKYFDFKPIAVEVSCGFQTHKEVTPVTAQVLMTNDWDNASNQSLIDSVVQLERLLDIKTFKAYLESVEKTEAAQTPGELERMYARFINYHPERITMNDNFWNTFDEFKDWPELERQFLITVAQQLSKDRLEPTFYPKTLLAALQWREYTRIADKFSGRTNKLADEIEDFVDYVHKKANGTDLLGQEYEIKRLEFRVLA